MIKKDFYFVEVIFNFIFGEILSPFVYKKDYEDIILCYIKFKDGHKTYSYISDFNNVEVGAKVVVSV